MEKQDSWFTVDQYGSAVIKPETQPHQMARNTDPDTSHEAARSVNVTKYEQEVYDAIKTFGADGCISDDIVSFLGRDAVSVTPRFKPLINKGYIVDTGERRPGKSGRKQRVMVAL